MNTINKVSKDWRIRTGVWVILGILIIGLAFAGTKAISNWFDGHKIQFNQVINIQVQSPITIKDREVEVKQIVQVINQIPNPVDLKTDTEKYIYEKFGIENYKQAIAIARAESGLREDAWNVNTNGSIDIGIFQVNSVHFKDPGCSLKEVTTMKGNVDCAYEMFKVSGFNPWVAFKSGAFIEKLN
jgi:hypothetical protein